MTYSLFLACERGTAPYVTIELEHKGFPKVTSFSETTVVVDGCSKEDLVRAAYTLQTPLRIGMLLGDTEISLDTEESILHLETLIGGLDLKDLLEEDKTFVVHCAREGLHEYNSVDMSQAAGRLFKRYAKEQLPFVPRVDLKTPRIKFYLHIDQEKGWLSLDLGGDVSKRSYKVFNNPHSVKGPTAMNLLMAAGWKPGKVMIDPFSSGGEIPIEAALFSAGRSTNFYEKNLICKNYQLFKEIFNTVLDEIDKKITSIDIKLLHSYDAQLRNVTAAKKNAKIAGVEKGITFSKMDIEWIDTKFSEKTIDCIVTRPVESSKHVKEENARDLHKKLFYVADYVLKKNGSLTFICLKPEELQAVASNYSFVVDNQKQIYTGKLGLWIIRFVRK